MEQAARRVTDRWLLSQSDQSPSVWGPSWADLVVQLSPTSHQLDQVHRASRMVEVALRTARLSQLRRLERIGALGKGTLLRGSMILNLAAVWSAFDVRHVPHYLADLQQAVHAVLVGATARFTDDRTSLTFTLDDVLVTITPVGHLGSLGALAFLRHRPSPPAVCSLVPQARFFAAQDQGFKDFARVCKYWRDHHDWLSEAHRLPTYLVELLALAVWQRRASLAVTSTHDKPVPMAILFDRFLATIAGYENLRVVFPSLYTEADVPPMGAPPIVVDPGNPAVNVAAALTDWSVAAEVAEEMRSRLRAPPRPHQQQQQLQRQQQPHRRRSSSSSGGGGGGGGGGSGGGGTSRKGKASPRDAAAENALVASIERMASRVAGHGDMLAKLLSEQKRLVRHIADLRAGVRERDKQIDQLRREARAMRQRVDANEHGLTMLRTTTGATAVGGDDLAARLVDLEIVTRDAIAQCVSLATYLYYTPGIGLLSGVTASHAVNDFADILAHQGNDVLERRFVVDRFLWLLRVYPHGDGAANAGHVSVFLELASSHLPPGVGVRTVATLTASPGNVQGRFRNTFRSGASYGWPKLLPHPGLVWTARDAVPRGCLRIQLHLEAQEVLL